MRVLVFGASGVTGRELIAQALALGHDVTAFVRRPAKFAISHPKLNVVTGDATDRAAVARAVQGQEVVFSALGTAVPTKPNPDLSIAMRNIVGEMEARQVHRLIYLSFGIDEEGRRGLGRLIDRYIANVLRYAIADHATNEALIRSSGLDWTIVRPPKLTNGRRTRSYRSGEHILQTALFSTLSRADLAEFMLLQIADRSFVSKTVRVLR